MKQQIIIILVFFWNPVFAQGKYAGSQKNLIGTIYTDSRNIPGLSGWKFRESTVISPVENPEMIIADVFQKEATYIVLFSVKEDITKNNFLITDLIEIKNVSYNQQIKTAVCKKVESENAEIIALVKPGTSKFSKAIKAWRFNRDKRKIELLSAKAVTCLNEAMN